MRNARGKAQALVEFAIVIPILFLILCALFDFGRVGFVAVQMETVAEDAARYLSRGHDLAALHPRLKLNVPAGVSCTPADIEQTTRDNLSVVTVKYRQSLVTVPMKALLGKELNYSVHAAVRSPVRPGRVPAPR